MEKSLELNTVLKKNLLNEEDDLTGNATLEDGTVLGTFTAIKNKEEN